MLQSIKTKNFTQIFKIITVVLICLGIFLRFADIDKKVFWTDETFTNLRIYGHTKSELKKEVFNSQILNSEYILAKYQLPTPDKNYLDIIKSLALEDPKHPPLYFLITRFWVDIFGHTVATTRSLSAAISLLVFPCLYWLCLELFQSSSVGLVALATISISPFHILFAQEARMYSLYTLIILLSSATLLRAMRINSKLSWCLYAVSLSLGFYTHSLFSLVAIGQGIYLFLIQGFRLNKTVNYYIIATLLGILTFLPWGFFIATQLQNVEKTIAWTKKINPPLSDLVDTWQINLARIFLDITPNYKFSDKLQNDIWFLLIRFICIIFLYGIYFVYRNTLKKVWLFILLLIGITFVLLAIPDVFVGGIQSTIARYLTPIFLGFHLAIAYLFAQKAFINDYSFFKRKIWRSILIVFLLMELVSCYVIFHSKTWNKAFNSDNISIVNIIHQTKNPILICSQCIGDGGWGNILSISYILKPTVKIQMFPGINISQNFDNFSDVFFIKASDEFRDHLKKEQNLDIALVYKNKLSLWKLERK